MIHHHLRLVTALCALVCSWTSVNAQHPIPPASRSYSQELMHVQGFSEAYRDVQVGSSDTGLITEIRVDEGATVQYGQVLVKLDDSVIRANVEVARDAARASGELATAKVQLETAKKRLQLAQDLRSRDHATEMETWIATMAVEESQARVQAFEELAQRRRLELVQAERQLERFTIRAPLDGIVVERLKDAGEVVSPADPHLLRIVQLDPLRITATISLSQAKKLSVGTSLLVTIAEDRCKGTIEFISPIVDVSSGTSVLQLRLANPDLKYSAGMPCEIDLTALDDSAAKGGQVARQTAIENRPSNVRQR